MRAIRKQNAKRTSVAKYFKQFISKLCSVITLYDPWLLDIFLTQSNCFVSQSKLMKIMFLHFTVLHYLMKALVLIASSFCRISLGLRTTSHGIGFQEISIPQDMLEGPDMQSAPFSLAGNENTVASV